MDKYSANARLYPMVILMLPLIVLGISYSLEMESYLNILTSLGVSGALSYFLSQVGRDAGKRKEKGLWDYWGGAPTSQLFSYQNSRIDENTKDRYHEKMNRVVPKTQEVDYKIAPIKETGKTYQAWTKYLITNTRDTKRYPLLFKELISYGFRRNLWGLKPFSIILIIICLLGNFGYNYIIALSLNPVKYSITFHISELILFLILIVWVFIVKRGWVRIPAFAYGERLLETIDIQIT